MKSFDNIEKSGFHKGQYVGYCESGVVMTIHKSTGSYGNWIAYAKARQTGDLPIYAWTLADMSEKLKAHKASTVGRGPDLNAAAVPHCPKCNHEVMPILPRKATRLPIAFAMALDSTSKGVPHGATGDYFCRNCYDTFLENCDGDDDTNCEKYELQAEAAKLASFKSEECLP